MICRWHPFVVLGALVAASSSFAQSVSYPSRPIRMIVPFVPGGSTDIIARLVARKMSEGLGQQVVVDNRSGGGGTAGAEITVRANPDGYTLILISGSYTVNPALYRLPYDPVRDVTPISMVGVGPFVIALHPSVPVRNVRELIDHARSNPGKLNYGSGGTGSLTHLVIELFKLTAGVDMTHIPYKGSGQAVAELIGGQIQLTFGAILSMLPHVNAGKLRGIAVTGKNRAQVAPDMPTVAESGLPGYEAVSWYGVLAPPKLPAAIVAALNAEMKRIVSQPDIRDRLAREGFDPLHTTPEAFVRTMAEDVAKWPKVVKAANIRVE